MLLLACGLFTFLSFVLQGTLTAIRDWFRDYKIPDGKPANKFGLGNKAADKVKNSLDPAVDLWNACLVYSLRSRRPI